MAEPNKESRWVVLNFGEGRDFYNQIDPNRTVDKELLRNDLTDAGVLSTGRLALGTHCTVPIETNPSMNN